MNDSSARLSRAYDPDAILFVLDEDLAALRGAATVSGMILFIIVGATTFSQILSFSGASSGRSFGTADAPVSADAAIPRRSRSSST